MLNRRHFVTAATAIAALFPAVVQAQAVGTPVEAPEPTPTASGRGVSDDPNEMIRWMAFEGATVVTLPATREVLIRELTGAIDLGYFTHNERTYPRGAGMETIHSYRITGLGRAEGHRQNLIGQGLDGDDFFARVGPLMSVGEVIEAEPASYLPTDGSVYVMGSSPGDPILVGAVEGHLRPSKKAGDIWYWTSTPYGAMMSRVGVQ